MDAKTQTVRRDSGTGKFITKPQADRRDPRTWKTQHIKNGKWVGVRAVDDLVVHGST